MLRSVNASEEKSDAFSTKRLTENRSERIIQKACSDVGHTPNVSRMDRTNIYLPKPLKKEMQQIARKRDVSLAEVIRQAASEYVKRENSNPVPTRRSIG